MLDLTQSFDIIEEATKRSHLMKKIIVKILILALAAAMAFSSAACKLTEDEEPAELFGLKVVMTSKNVDMTMYDFGQSYRTNDYYQYAVYGLIAQDQYCEYVINDIMNFMYILNAADTIIAPIANTPIISINDRPDCSLIL